MKLCPRHSFIVIPHAHSHLVSLMSLLNVKCTPFPSLFSSPQCFLNQGSQRHFQAAQEVGVDPLTHPLAGGSLATWSIPLQTHITFQSPTVLQRIALKPNLLYERQDTTSSVKYPSGSKDCPTRLSKSTITSARKQSKS